MEGAVMEEADAVEEVEWAIEVVVVADRDVVAQVSTYRSVVFIPPE